MEDKNIGSLKYIEIYGGLKILEHATITREKRQKCPQGGVFCSFAMAAPKEPSVREKNRDVSRIGSNRWREGESAQRKVPLP